MALLPVVVGKPVTAEAVVGGASLAVAACVGEVGAVVTAAPLVVVGWEAAVGCVVVTRGAAVVLFTASSMAANRFFCWSVTKRGLLLAELAQRKAQRFHLGGIAGVGI